MPVLIGQQTGDQLAETRAPDYHNQLMMVGGEIQLGRDISETPGSLGYHSNLTVDKFITMVKINCRWFLGAYSESQLKVSSSYIQLDTFRLFIMRLG